MPKTVFDFLDEEEPEIEIEEEKVKPQTPAAAENIVFADLEEEKEPEPVPVEQQKPQEFPFEGENDLEREIERAQARTTSRIAETVLGAPGDISNFITSLLGLPKAPIGYLSSDVLKKGSEKLTAGYTKPKNEFEKAVDEASETFASMALPGSWGYGFARNLGIPIASTLTKEGLKSKFGEKEGTYGGLGVMVFLDLLGGRISQGGAKKFAGDLFKQRNSTIPEGAKTDAHALKTSMQDLQKELKKGGIATSDKPALNKIDEVISAISDEGVISVEELPKFQTKINEAIKEAGGFEIQAPREVKQKAVRNLNQVKDKIVEAQTKYGEIQNPEFLDLHKQANRAFAVYEQSNKLSNFFRKHFGNKITNPIMKTLLGLGTSAAAGAGAIFSPAITGLAGAAGGSALGLYQAFKLGYRVVKSPELRRHYQEVLKNAASNNVAKTEKSLKALEKALKEHQEELEESLAP